MARLSLVKTLSHLQEEQRYSDEIELAAVGIAFTRGSITELSGGAGSGKTSLSLMLLAELTRVGEICAVVDASNSFDPGSAARAGVELGNMLWVKCGGEMERSFMAADYLVQAKGFGAVWLSLNGLPQRQLAMVPRAYWYRYRTRIKETPTLFLVTAEDTVTGTASQKPLLLSRERSIWSGSGRFKLLREFHIGIRSRKQFNRDPLIAQLKADHTHV